MPKILVVEDNIALLKALETKLQHSGYKTIITADGGEVMEKIEKENPDAILLDILLPNKSGMEILEELSKKGPPFKLPIIIVISNSGQYIETERAKKLGVKDFLVKTDFTPQEVLDKLEKFIPAPNPTSGEPMPSDHEDHSSAKKESPKSEKLKESINDSGKVVMIVEDDNLLRRLLTKGLAETGFTVEAMAGGKEALERLETITPNIVLLDLVMPGMDGFQVLENIRKNPKTKDLPVIILSNLGDEESVKRAKSLGIEDYLIKADIFLGEVQDKVRETIKKHIK